MNDSDGVLVELDQLGVEILEALVAHGGEATSTELRKYLGIESTTRFNYRVREYLAPEGLVDTHQPEAEPGHYPAKEVTLTEQGKEYLEAVAAELETERDIADRVDRLEEQVDALREENKELRRQNEELSTLIESSNLDRISGDVRELVDEMNTVQNELRNIKQDPLLGDEDTRRRHDMALILGNTSKRMFEGLIDDGEEQFEQEMREVREQLSEKGALLES